MIALKNCTDWGFPARLRMLGVVVMLVGIAVSGQKACAQFTPCDSGYIAAADTFLFQYDRRCCAVVFHSCIKLGEIKFSGLDFDQSCFDFDVNTAPSIYAAVVQRGFEIALYNHVGTITGNAVLPACPQTSSWTMKTVAATCGAWVEVPYSHENQIQIRRYFFPCAFTTCEQTCVACISTVQDACGNEEPYIYFDCENQPSPPNCQGTCPIGICVDLRPMP